MCVAVVRVYARMTAIVAPLMFLQPTKLLRGERKTYQCLPIWLALGGGVSFA